MSKLIVLLLLGLAGNSCQTSSTQRQQETRKKTIPQRNQSAEKIVGNNEANSLSKGWDSGLLEFGDKERSRQSLDMN